MKQTALITGASSGIGKALAYQFAADKIDLVLVARREEKLRNLKHELEKNFGITVSIYQKDLSEPNAANDVLGFVSMNNIEITHLVNNAGFGDHGPFIDTDWNKESAMIQLNITALTQLCKVFLPGMKKRGSGHILNVASTAAFQPGPMMAVYFATKSYVLHFSEAIANELEGTGITVTALCPGPTRTEFEDVASIGKAGMFKGKIPTAEAVAQYGYTAMKQGKVVAVHGLKNRMLIFLNRLTPRAIIVKIVRSLQD